MASIRQRRNGWSVLWREDCRQRSRMFTKERDAQMYARRVECGTADVSPAAIGSETFGQAAERWISTRRPATRDKYGTVLHVHLAGVAARKLSARRQ